MKYYLYEMKKKIIISGIVLAIVIISIVSVVFIIRIQNPTEVDSSVDSIDASLEIIDVETFKVSEQSDQVNVLGNIQNNSAQTKSANVRISITGSNGGLKQRIVTVNKIAAGSSRQFGATEDGYPEGAAGLKVKVAIVATFTD